MKSARISGSSTTPIMAVIAPAECRSRVPMASESRPRSATNRPAPTVAPSHWPAWATTLPASIEPRIAESSRSDSGTRWPDRAAELMSAVIPQAAVVVTNDTPKKTMALAVSTRERLGQAVNVVRIMPVLYSEVTTKTPRVITASWPSISPNRPPLSSGAPT
ncbi:hypothetical protein [Streptomyces sp. SPB162]|uniref:hypothetical protein n=1 Tax=Streptomyces sp. SPB162 TaxID=2940560 RepID=UPI002406D1A1|nr:hypothetical protein [Streptomyces sp. SPB162]